MPDPQGIQYPIGYQPYEPIQYPTGYQPFPEATPIGTAMAARTGMYVPEWMQKIGKIGSDIYSASLEPLVGLFGQIKPAAKSAAHGDFSPALNLTTETFASPMKQQADTYGRMWTNQFPLPGATWESSEEEKRRAGIAKGAEMFGLEPEKVLKAYETNDWATLGGMAAGGIGFNALLHYGGRALGGVGRESAPPRPTEATPPPPPSAGMMEPTQPRLPGMENLAFGVPWPESMHPEMPTNPSANPRLRATAVIEANAQQKIFELQLQLADAKRSGNLSAATQIENAILEVKMQAAEQSRNWQPPPDPVFEQMPEGQGSLNFGAVRGAGGRWQPAGEFAYEGTPRPTPFDVANNPPPPVVEPPPVAPPVDSTGTPFEQAMRAQMDTGEGDLPPIIDMPTNQGELAVRKAQGYKTIPGEHRNPVNGRQQMVRGPLADMMPAAPTPTPVIPDFAGAARASAISASRGRVGSDIPVDSTKVTPELEADMAGRGYTPVMERDGITTFRHKSSMGDLGMVDYGALAEGIGELKDKFAEWLRGRFPSEGLLDSFFRENRLVAGRDDVAQTFERLYGTRSPIEGERKGGVAEFETKADTDVRKSLAIDELLQFAEHFRQTNDNPRLLGQIEAELRRRGVNPDTAEVPPYTDKPLYEGWDWKDKPREESNLPTELELDLMEIREARTPKQVNDLIDFWSTKLDEWRASGEVAAVTHANEMIEAAQARFNQLGQQSVPPELGKGVLNHAVAALNQETDLAVLQDNLRNVKAGLDYHRRSGDSAELELYEQLYDLVLRRIIAVDPPKLSARDRAWEREKQFGPQASGPRGIADPRINRPVPFGGQGEGPFGPKEVQGPPARKLDEKGIPVDLTWEEAQRMKKVILDEAKKHGVDPESGAVDPRIFDPREWVKAAFTIPPGEKASFAGKFWGLSTAATTVWDWSMPFRQGLPTIFTKEWAEAWKPMFKGGWSAEFAKMIDDQIRAKEIFQETWNPETNKWEKSIAEKYMGLKLIEAGDVSASESGLSSNWVETGGNIPYASAAYRAVPGRLAKGSNRAAATFLNHLRANLAERMMETARDSAVEAADTGSAKPGLFRQNFTPKAAAELNPYSNTVLAKSIGDFVNTVTGRAPLRLEPWMKGIPNLDIEFMAKGLSALLFSPRNLASRLRLMNPGTYLMADPFTRKQYMKAALSTMGGWYLMTQAMQGFAKATGRDDVQVSNDPLSADFGKVRVGDTRFDFGGGFLQPYVAFRRLMDGYYTSSATGKKRQYGAGFRGETQEGQLERFGVNKLNPMTKFIYDAFAAAEYNPFHVADRTLQMFVPLAAQDAYELFTKDKTLLPFMAPVLFGGGTQTYEKGESVSKFIPPEYDWISKGGGLGDFLYPWRWDMFENR